jgi:hypothetical protein
MMPTKNKRKNTYDAKRKKGQVPVLGPRGPLHDDVKGYIARYHNQKTAEQMAEELGRPERAESIQGYINKTFGDNRKFKKELLLSQELETKPEYQNFRKQFTDEELGHFRNRYVQLMSQFRDDIQTTDEIQIFQVITIDILIQRTMKEHKDIEMERIKAHEVIEKVTEEFKETGDKSLLDDLKGFELRYAQHSKTLNDLTQRYQSYLMRQSAMLKELKATRDQRMKMFQDSDKNFLGFLRLLAEEDQQIVKGREAEMMRLASQNEARRLAEPHTYDDGAMDQPLLTPETVRDY